MCFCFRSQHLLLVTLAALAACSPSPEGPADGGSNGVRVTGSERLGWSQAAASLAEAAAYEYVVYVDGQRTVSARASCTQGTGASYECSTPLPRLAPGRRVLQVAAVAVVDGVRHEGPRSEPLLLHVESSASTSSTLAGSTESPPAAERPSTRSRCFDRRSCYQVYSYPVSTEQRAIAALPDGRAVVVDERSGGLFTFDAGRMTRLEVSPLCGPGGRITSAAVHPEFGANGFLYVAWTCAGRGQDADVRVVRYRELAGVLGEGATILEWPVRGDGQSRAAFGGDGKVYVAAPEQRGWAILRANPDGSTPQGNPGGSIVVGRTEDVVALSGATRGAWVLGMRSGLIVYETTPGDAGRTILVSRSLRLPAAPGPLASAANDEDAGDQQSFMSTGRSLLRLRMGERRSVPVLAGAVELPECGAAVDLTSDARGAIWATGVLDSPSGTTRRLCHLVPEH